MKKVVVVAALLAAMVLVDWLERTEVAGAASLAGMGFVMLTAYAVAEIGGALTLPQVTGYILAGVVLGPSVGGIISGELVGDMRMFNTLALGLIATSAGLELDVRQMARLAKTLVLTTAIKVLVGVSAVALAFIAVESTLGLLALEGPGELSTLALILGVLSVGTSPSITLAVLSETGAKGRLSDLVLGAAIFKDLVVVIGLAVATAVGRVWLAPGAALDAKVLVDVAVELGGSILAGSLVGLVFIGYVRFIRAEMLLFVAAMILVVAELCRAFHLELLLVFISSGVVVRNFSSFEHELMRPLRLVALPVFVLFFANAGASVDLPTTWQILPLALACCAARALAYLLASQVGGRWAGESRNIRKHAWLAYLPQAGVTLGLVGVAALQVPELAGPITNTGMAVVAVNLLIGPITLRRALGALGEIPHAGAAPSPAGAPAGPPRAAPETSSIPPAPLPEPSRALRDQLASNIARVLHEFDADIEPALERLPALGGAAPEPEVFVRVVSDHRARYLELYEALIAQINALPALVRVEQPRGRALWAPIQRELRVPVRRVARVALGPAAARLVSRRFEAGLGAGHAAREQGTASELPAEIEQGLAQLTELLRQVGTRQLPARRVRYSDVEPGVRRALTTLTVTTEAELARLARAAWGTALLASASESIVARLNDALGRALREPSCLAAAKVGPAVQELTTWMAQHAEPGARGDGGAASGAWREALETLAAATLGELSREFRFAATVRATLVELGASVADAPDGIDCLLLERGASLAHGRIINVHLRAHVDALIRHLMPPIDLAARSVATALNQLPRRVEETMAREWAQLDAERDAPASVRAGRFEHGRSSRLQYALEDLARATARAIDAALAALDVSLGSTYAAFRDDLLPGPDRDGYREARLQRWAGAARRARERALASLQHWRWGGPPLVNADAIGRYMRGLSRADLPEQVRRWFDGSPVSDERLFAAHRRLLNYVLDADASRAETGRSGVLVVGSRGTGKSSLLNLCELELSYAVHVRLHASEFARDTPLFDAMAASLDCPPTMDALVQQLELRSPAVFVDDLHAWIGARANRQLELERVLQLLAQSSHRAFWVVSMDASMFKLLGELVPLEEVFTHVASLRPFGVADARRLVEARLELMNTSVEFRSGRWESLFDRLGSSTASERFYRRLTRLSRGRPSRIVALCREAMHIEGQQLSLAAGALRAPAALEHAFTPVQVATLAVLHRYGPLSIEQLAGEVAATASELSRSVAFLMTARLVHQCDDATRVGIAREAEWVVHQILVRARLALE